MKKIALEEHFMAPGLEAYWQTLMADVEPATHDLLLAHLRDFGELRLNAMHRAGVERSVLSIAGPGVQIERDVKTACRKAGAANDFLAKQINSRPDRFAGFAHLPMQDPKAAADELERCMRDFGFCGAMIHGHTNGQYLDHPALDAFWDRAQALSALIYLHPADPATPYAAFSGHPALTRATWGWGVETGTHALRLVFGGVFERFPRAKLALGHLGETLPFLLWRFDSRAHLYGVKLSKPPSEYIKQNIVVTTSGMLALEPLLCTVAALGHSRVMFAADYPFESIDDAGKFMDNAVLDEELRADIAYKNAEKWLALTPTADHGQAAKV
jgi:2,3-dihydroxybenzoate decarboxylase